jgi:enoyl-CoA hydratase/carnithine racemase
LGSGVDGVVRIDPETTPEFEQAGSGPRRTQGQNSEGQLHRMNNEQSAKAMGTQPTLEIDGARARIELNRPGLHNRLEPEDLDMLERLFAEIDAAPGVRVAILASRGRTFSAGFQIGAIEGGQGTGAAPRAFERMANRLENLRVPTICALQGGVYGGAADLALACDFRIGVESVELRVPAAVLGVHYYASGLRRFVTRVGLGAAKRVFLMADTLDAQELRRIGYLDEIVPAADLEAAVDRRAARMAALAPIAVQGMKRALDEAARAELDLAATDAVIERALQSEDLRTGLEAWTRKAAPLFRGR